MLIKKPKNFNFRNTVFSHGWCELAPFSLDEEKWELSCVFNREGKGRPILAKLSETEKSVKIEISGRKVSKKTSEKIIDDVKHILRFDDDLDEFYSLIKKEKDFAWMAKTGTGRLLRSPTVFEDLVKTICTTNCSWALTKNMVANLVEKLGEKTADGKGIFPTVETMAEVDVGFYRDEIRSGYRSSYFVELSESIVEGGLDPEKWMNSDLPTAELKKEMKQVKGVGDYAAENLLKLVGRYDGLSLDSWLRSEFYKRHNKEKVCPDKKIEKFYSRFGKWRGLAIWFDMSSRWFD